PHAARTERRAVRPRAAKPGVSAGFLLVMALATFAPAAPAQSQGPDAAWAREGLALLATSQSDSLGPTEARAFDAFDRIAQRYFSALGSRHMQGARGVMTVFDSLGVPAEMAQDVELPQFCAVTFFHPAFAGHAAVTYLYWFIGEDLQRQRLLLTGGRGLQLEVWWTGAADGPYEAGLLDRRRTGDTAEAFFTLLRLAPNAQVWSVIQYGRRGVDLGGRGPARFVDLNNDALPELVSWTEAPPEPRFVVDSRLPPLLSERLWQRTDSGFALFDRRTVPTPFATWVLFLRALGAGETVAARALVTAPAVVTRARALGLGAVRAKGSWQVLDSPPGDRWNQRMTFLYGTPKPTKGLEVGMKFVDGHWLLERIESRPRNPAPPVLVPPTPGPGR
ncbi:MAG: hypothetical protein ABIP29_08160, partial [Candidatus Eisenbacteria bacterium]